MYHNVKQKVRFKQEIWKCLHSCLLKLGRTRWGISVWEKVHKLHKIEAKVLKTLWDDLRNTFAKVVITRGAPSYPQRLGKKGWNDVMFTGILGRICGSLNHNKFGPYSILDIFSRLDVLWGVAG